MNPQSKALMIGRYGCLAMCYAYCMGVPENELINTVSKAMDEDLLDDECTVLDADKYLKWLSGKNYKVEKVQIKSLEDVGAMTPVRFDYGSNYHWVVVDHGNIAFNSLDISNCVINGKPTMARVINAKE